MKLEIKFKSIAVRWFLNTFLIVAVAILAVAVAFCFLFNSMYTERIEALADDYSYEFTSLSNTNDLTFGDTAFTIAGEFEHKSRLEVQVIDKDDRVIVSTTGFQSNDSLMPDLMAAKEDGKSATIEGESIDGESIMACTTLVYGYEGEYLGAYRWITSMEAADKMMNNVALVVAAIAAGVLGFFALTGLYFIKSIVKPIRDVSAMARKIAMGDFESRIEMQKNDEVGELCDTINYMASELSSAQNLKNDFISSVSHELRTPLTAIRGWGETAKMSIGTDDELVQKGLDVVLSEADRLSNLVEELLDFSRIETGRLTLISREINISRILFEVYDMYAELSRQKGIELLYNPPTEEYQIMGDPDRLKQVFINIIDNAVKYTESGGQVLVDQTVEEACVRISVQDTGVGIPAADIDRIKEKFYKANKTVRGSGIGLAVADEIVKQHQGLLFVESTEGVGTTVTIVLPLYEKADAAEEEQEHITLIEDEDISPNEELTDGVKGESGEEEFENGEEEKPKETVTGESADKSEEIKEDGTDNA